MARTQPIRDTLTDLREAMIYLDYLADTTISETMHVRARMMATKVARAIDAVETLAGRVEAFAAIVLDPSGPDPEGPAH